MAGLPHLLATEDRDGRVRHRFFFLLTKAFPSQNQYASASADTRAETQRLEWFYSPQARAGSASAGLSAERAPESEAFQGRADYATNRGILGITQEESRPASAADWAHRTSLRARTALVAAGGRVALSQPVSDSFVLVAPQKKLAGETIALNPRDEGAADAWADGLGPGVIPNLVSYHYYRLQLDSSLLRRGRVLERENYALLPSYRSGILILPGSEAAVIVSGTLSDASAPALPLVSGEVQPSGALFFTNRKGRFRIEGLKPGTYALRFFDEAYESVVFTIPENADGIFDMGILLAPRRKGPAR